MAAQRSPTTTDATSCGTVVIGSDHGGYRTKQAVIRALAANRYTIVDVGGFDPAVPDDYPVYAHEVARAVAGDRTGKTSGVLICGSGTGMSIAANRHKGVRAALVYDSYSARMARHDNDANIACLRGRGFSEKRDVRLVLRFLRTPFSGIPRHARRIRKIDTGGKA